MRNKLSQRIVILLKAITLLTILTACGAIKTKVSSQQKRVFLDLSLEFIGAYQLPKTTFNNTPVGGLSALTYNSQQQRFYAVSDDRSKARFYTLNPRITTTATGLTVLEEIKVENVTFLTDEKGNLYPEETVDTEGIALASSFTLFISSEGVTNQGIAPFVGEFDLQTGKLQQSLTIPERYLPTAKAGVRDNLGFEALTLSPHSLTTTDTFRLFTATESALLQDNSEEQNRAPIRLLHYLINPTGESILVAEHLYLLDSAPSDVIYNGLTELTALEKEGYFLSLERTFGFSGTGAKIFQIAMGNATDISNIPSLKGNISTIQPVQKKLLLNLAELGIELDNLEGMILGPILPDGSQSLVLVSDDNFRNDQFTQFLLFKIIVN